MSQYNCSCGKELTFTIASPVTLDEAKIQEIDRGDGFNLECPDCGRVLKVEEQVLFQSPVKGYSLFFIPENDRTAFQLGKIPVSPETTRVVIGYKELVEKIRIFESRKDDRTLEILKSIFLLRQKKNLSLYFKGQKEERLEFFIEGLKPGEIGFTSVPLSAYEDMGKKLNTLLEEDATREFTTPPYVNANQIDYEMEADL